MTEEDYSDGEFRIVSEHGRTKELSEDEKKGLFRSGAESILESLLQDDYACISDISVNDRELIYLLAKDIDDDDRVAGLSGKEVKALYDRMYALGPYLIVRTPDEVRTMIYGKEPGFTAIILWEMVRTLLHKRTMVCGGLNSAIISVFGDGIIDTDDLCSLICMGDTYENALNPRWEGTVQSERIIGIYEKMYGRLNEVRP